MLTQLIVVESIKYQEVYGVGKQKIIQFKVNVAQLL